MQTMENYDSCLTSRRIMKAVPINRFIYDSWDGNLWRCQPLREGVCHLLHGCVKEH